MESSSSADYCRRHCLSLLAKVKVDRLFLSSLSAAAMTAIMDYCVADDDSRDAGVCLAEIWIPVGGAAIDQTIDVVAF